MALRRYNKCNFKLFFGSPEEMDPTSESEGAESDDKSASEECVTLSSFLCVSHSFCVR
jgi:hypothetical protein